MGCKRLWYARTAQRLASGATWERIFIIFRCTLRRVPIVVDGQKKTAVRHMCEVYNEAHDGLKFSRMIVTWFRERRRNRLLDESHTTALRVTRM